MRDLYEALTILISYNSGRFEDNFWQAEHDEAYFTGPAPEMIAEQHLVKLEELGFTYEKSTESWHTFS